MEHGRTDGGRIADTRNGEVPKTAALVVLRSISPNARQITTKALRQAVKRIVAVAEVDEMLDVEQREPSVPDVPGAGAGRSRMRGRGRGQSEARGRGRGQSAARGRGRGQLQTRGRGRGRGQIPQA